MPKVPLKDSRKQRLRVLRNATEQRRKGLNFVRIIAIAFAFGSALGAVVIGFVNGWNEPMTMMSRRGSTTDGGGFMTPIVMLCTLIPVTILVVIILNKFHRHLKFKILAIEKLMH